MSDKPLPHEMFTDGPFFVSALLRVQSPCTACGELIGGATGPAAPRPNDISVCWHCGHASVFGADGVLLPLDLSTVEPEVRLEIETLQALVSGGKSEG